MKSVSFHLSSILVSFSVKLYLWWQDGDSCSYLVNNSSEKKSLFPSSANKSTREEAHWPGLGHMSVSEPIIAAREMAGSDWPDLGLMSTTYTLRTKSGGGVAPQRKTEVSL